MCKLEISYYCLILSFKTCGRPYHVIFIIMQIIIFLCIIKKKLKNQVGFEIEWSKKCEIKLIR